MTEVVALPVAVEGRLSEMPEPPRYKVIKLALFGWTKQVPYIFRLLS